MDALRSSSLWTAPIGSIQLSASCTPAENYISCQKRMRWRACQPLLFACLEFLDLGAWHLVYDSLGNRRLAN